MSFIKEFKDFAMKGNLIDMAVGFVMGAAFTAVTGAFINGMVMPLVGMLTSGQDFNKLAWVIQPEVKDAAGVITTPAITVAYGTFISEVITFIVVAFVMFMVVKAVNNMKKKQAEAPAAPSSTDVLLTEIRDALRK